MSFSRIVVLGQGKIGHLATEMLASAGFSVTGGDMVTRVDGAMPSVAIDVSDRHQLERLLGAHEAVLSCLPYALNRQVAEVAHACGIHYFDLT